MSLLEAFKNLLVMAAADGVLTEHEVNFLTDRSHQWNIDDNDFTSAIEYALSGQGELTLPNDHAARLEMLRDLIRVMAADGQLAETEKRLFAAAAAKMEVSEDELNAIVDSVL